MLLWCYLKVAVAAAGAILAPNFFIYCGLRFLSAFGLAGIIMTQATLSRYPGGLRSFSCPIVEGASASPFSGCVDHSPQEGCYHDDLGLHLQHRPDGLGRPGLGLAGLAKPPAGCVHPLLGHIPAVLVSTLGSLFMGDPLRE